MHTQSTPEVGTDDASIADGEAAEADVGANAQSADSAEGAVSLR